MRAALLHAPKAVNSQMRLAGGLHYGLVYFTFAKNDPYIPTFFCVCVLVWMCYSCLYELLLDCFR